MGDSVYWSGMMLRCGSVVHWSFVVLWSLVVDWSSMVRSSFVVDWSSMVNRSLMMAHCFGMLGSHWLLLIS